MPVGKCIKAAIAVVGMLLGLAPMAAPASCVQGAPPAYRDITYISVEQSSLVDKMHPKYSFTGTLYPTGPKGLHADAWLTAKHGTRLRGYFVAADQLGTFQRLLGILRRDRFFELRLTPIPPVYLDGPEDGIIVSWCGVTTTLGTASYAGEVSLSDVAAQRFFHLEDDLRHAIFAERWITPTPQPVR